MGKAADLEEAGEYLSEADRRALRGSRFASLSPPRLGQSQSKPHPRLAHPGGPVATNKAAALAKFLERKLHEPGGLSSINPDHLEVAVKNAKETLRASSTGASTSGRVVRHVTSFGDSFEENDQSEDENKEIAKEIKKKRHRKQQKKKRKEEKNEGESKEMREEIKKKKHKKQQKKRKEKTFDTDVGRISMH